MSIHRSRSFWFRSSDAYTPAEPVDGEMEFDVAIVGGGVTGVSTAYHLAKLDPSVRVALLEAEVIGFGASGRNAGQLIVHFGGLDLAGHIRRYGARNVGDAWTYVGQGIAFIEQLQAEEGLEFDYCPKGDLQVGLKVDQAKALEAYRTFLATIGQLEHMVQLSEAEVAAEIRSPYFGKGLLDPRGGQFNPLKLVRGLAAASRRRGVQIFEHSPVVRIDTRGAKLALHTPSGVVRCNRLVLATNAYTHKLQGLDGLRMARQQNPMIVHASVTEPVRAEQWASLGWKKRFGVNVISELFYSFAPTIDDRLVYVGGYYLESPDGGELGPEVSLPFKAEGHIHLECFFPALAGLRTTQTWGGPISTTFDFIPHVGVAADPRIAYAVGCWGHGMPLGARNGRTLAELALGRTTDSTQMWFVRRQPDLWPPRFLATMGSRRLAQFRRTTNGRIGRSMEPPLAFGQAAKTGGV